MITCIHDTPNSKESAQINCNNQQQVDDNAKRIDELEARYKEDDKFTITRAKIINFLEENNIE